MNTEIRFALGECKLGKLLIASSNIGLCAILMGDDAQALLDDLQKRFPAAELRRGDADFGQVLAQVVALVASPPLALTLPLDIRGTAFQKKVWQALTMIPAGSTVSYTELARLIGVPKAVRAVASACAANTLAVAIPCHRAVRRDGSISGYRWGVERKRALLVAERAGDNQSD